MPSYAKRRRNQRLRSDQPDPVGAGFYVDLGDLLASII